MITAERYIFGQELDVLLGAPLLVMLQDRPLQQELQDGQLPAVPLLSREQGVQLLAHPPLL